jgi:hypothetical protein
VKEPKLRVALIAFADFRENIQYACFIVIELKARSKVAKRQVFATRTSKVGTSRNQLGLFHRQC